MAVLTNNHSSVVYMQSFQVAGRHSVLSLDERGVWWQDLKDSGDKKQILKNNYPKWEEILSFQAVGVSHYCHVN